MFVHRPQAQQIKGTYQETMGQKGAEAKKIRREQEL